MNRVILAKQTDETAQFDRIYETFHVRIPNAVVAFLKQNSRGIPKEKALSGTKDLFVSCFVSVSERDKANIFSLTKACNENSANSTLVPIALDGFGGMYCLRFVDLKQNGIIYLCEDNSDQVFVCEDFDGFLKKLNLQ